MRAESGPSIPVVGRLTPWELAGFIAFPLIIAFGILCLVVVWPLLDKISDSGNGGAAAMWVFMFLLFPGFGLAAICTLGGSIGLGFVAWRTRSRLRRKTAVQGSAESV